MTTSYTTAQKRYGLNNMNVLAQRAKLGDLVYASAGGLPGDYPSNVYYVNNLTGSASNDGLSWDTAFAQPSTAITAVAAFQAAQTDIYTRCIIYIAGTLTAYAALTALPSHCDMIGVGDDPRGNGSGIARIGPDDNTGTKDGVLVADTIRGTNFYNLQFQAASGKDAFNVTNVYRCVFENCAFMANGVAVSPTAGFKVAKGSGIVMDNCHFGSASSTDFVVGISVTGTHWHNCKVTNCHITGITGILIAAGCTSGYNSQFDHNVITHGMESQTKSINDDATSGHINYTNNVVAVQGDCANAGAARYGNNIVMNATAIGVVNAA